MIKTEEIHKTSEALGVPLVNLEKDYVMGWMLWAIYSQSRFSETLVLKGGNCLRKVYFPETRFSDDLDFTALAMPTEQEFKDEINALCRTVRTKAGIPFELDQTRVEETPTPNEDCKAIDARVYFRGIAGDSSLIMRIKFDITEFETIIFPPVVKSLLHNYSDSESCKVNVRAYTIEEVLAEKLRSWIQRTRARDLFDAVKIIQELGSAISKRRILDAFLRKTIFKGMPRAGRDHLIVDEKFQVAEQAWLMSIICPANAMIVFLRAVELFRQFVEALFGPATLSALGFGVGPIPIPLTNRATSIREAIIQAGRLRQTMLMRYHGIEREIEPYSFKYKVRSNGEGAEYFYGFDKTRDDTIKRFFISEIQSVRASGRPFTPRYVVEF
jgi:predicted nucleotidyltransferase component of viral defense system